MAHSNDIHKFNQVSHLSRLALDTLEAGVLIFNSQLELIFVNSWFVEHAQEAELILGESFESIFPKMQKGRVHTSLSKCLSFGLSKRIATKLLDVPFPLFDQVQGKTELLQSISIYPMVSEGEKFVYVDIQNVTNIYKREEELKEQAINLEKLASFDPLTGLANRRYFNQRLEEFIAQSKRNQTRFALMFLDLDHFKQVNDQFGHDIGDQLLKQVSEYLLSILRQNDVVGRLGGDEFIVLLDNIVREDQPAQVASKILEGFTAPWKIFEYGAKVGASIGISVFPDDGGSAREMLQKADAAMYSSKKLGRGRFQYYSEKMGQSVLQRAHLEVELKRAVDQGEFELYFQPQIDMETREIYGCEALIRWNHPERGQVLPADFISVAEENYSIVMIGKWVIEESARFMRTLKENGLEQILMSINLSPRQFDTISLFDVLQKALKECDLEARHFILEITESHLMRSKETSTNTLLKLKEHGYKIALDDFGTGYSSLAYLKNLPLDFLKIDRVFIKDLEQDKVDQQIISSIIELAQGLSLQVVAEGAESIEQVEKLNALGCEVVQGFYYAKPMPGANFIEYCKNFTQDRSMML